MLQGVGAFVTQDNVLNLDEWQTAEGGSTNNTAAYNPYNTRRVTDMNQTPLNSVISTNTFPAFADWPAGCAATVATILQPNMAPIATALKGGRVSPPGLFLQDVDSSQWCAPAPDGTPCYESQIAASKGHFVVSTSSVGALEIFSDTRSALATYNEDTSATATEEAVLEAETQQLSIADQQVSNAQRQLAAAAAALRRLALYDYTTNQAETRSANLLQFDAPNQREVLAEFYNGVDSSVLKVRYQESQAALASAVLHRTTVAASVARAQAARDSAVVAQTQAFAHLRSEIATIQTAGACTTPPLGSPAPPAPSAGDQGASTQVLLVALGACLLALTPPPGQ